MTENGKTDLLADAAAVLLDGFRLGIGASRAEVKSHLVAHFPHFERRPNNLPPGGEYAAFRVSELCVTVRRTSICSI
jgi:hypothetical protein